MKSGFNLFWSARAELDLKLILDYLDHHWTDREVKQFVERLERRLRLITANPQLFPQSRNKSNLHRSVLSKFTTVYYLIKGNDIILVTLFDTRQNPNKINP